MTQMSPHVPSIQPVINPTGDTSLIIKLALLMTLLFIFLIPWGNVVWDGFTRIFGMMAFALSALVFVVHGTHRNYSLFHLFLLLFGAWTTLTLIWSPDLIAGKQAALTLLQLVFTAFILTLIIDSKKKIRLAYQSYVFGTSVGSLIIIYNFLNGIESKYWGRYGLENYEVDGVSIILALSIPMSAYLTTQYKSKLFRLINLIAIPLCFFAIFLTATRTAFIVGIFGLIYWVYTHRQSSFRIKILFFGFFVASVIAVFLLAPKGSVDRLFTSGKSISSGTLNNRTVIWGAALEQWKNAPVTGNGIGSLAFVLSPAHVEYGSAHNTYIQILTENGILGLALYLLLISSIVYYIFKSRGNDRLFMLSLLGVVLVSALSMNTLLAKGSWFALSMLAIQAYFLASQTTD